MATKISKKNEQKYFCNICDFYTCKITDYNRHNLTQKHIRNELATDSNKNLDKAQHICENCSKEYNDRTGLWRHKKVCKLNDEKNLGKNLCELDKDELIITLLKQNADLIKGQQDMMIKLTENGITNNSHNTTTNSTN
jgi:hypothetical protein